MSETLDNVDSEQNQAVPQRTALSLRQLVMLLTTVVVGIVLLLAAISFRLFTKHMDELVLDHSQQQLQIAQGSLVQRLGFYKDLLHAYATESAVRDILAFGDRNEAISWSRQVRTALPQSIGAGLFTADGEVLGEPQSMLIGKACLIDMAQRVAGHVHDELPIHDGIEGLEHFDMAAAVAGEGGERLGLVFVSFSLGELNRAMEGLSSPEIAVALIHNGSGMTVAASKNWQQFAAVGEISMAVPETRWNLHLRTQAEGLLPALPVLSMAIVAGAGLLIVVMLFFHRLLMSGYLSVVDDLRAALRGISEGRKVDGQILAAGSQLFSVSDHLGDDLVNLSRQQANLHLESRTDTLTALPNRRVFDAALEELLSSNQGGVGFSVMLMDLDGFKGTNDRFGHPCGDLVLQALATAILQVARSSDLASRWGGDEFALLMLDMGDKDVAAWIGRLRGAFDVAQREYADLPAEGYCGVSCGFTHVPPGDTRSAAEVLKDADASLYRDKTERKARR